MLAGVKLIVVKNVYIEAIRENAFCYRLRLLHFLSFETRRRSLDRLIARLHFRLVHYFNFFTRRRRRWWRPLLRHRPVLYLESLFGRRRWCGLNFRLSCFGSLLWRRRLFRAAAHLFEIVDASGVNRGTDQSM